MVLEKTVSWDRLLLSVVVVVELINPTQQVPTNLGFLVVQEVVELTTMAQELQLAEHAPMGKATLVERGRQLEALKFTLQVVAVALVEQEETLHQQPLETEELA